MKRVICIVMILIISIGMTGAIFAETTTASSTVAVSEQSVPLAASTTDANSNTYDTVPTSAPTTAVIITETSAPQGAASLSSQGETLNVINNKTPKGAANLPVTGGVPAEYFYFAGLLIAAVGLIVWRVTSRTPSSGKN